MQDGFAPCNAVSARTTSGYGKMRRRTHSERAIVVREPGRGCWRSGYHLHMGS